MGVRPAEKLEGLNGERARLVEPALGEFGTVERHRNDKHFGGSLASELRDGLGQHPAQAFRGGVQVVVFESVNRFPHAALVDTVGDGSNKGWRR